MLSEKLKDWQYYYDKLPLYMKNSYGIQDHFRIIFGMMIAMDVAEVDICKMFDFLDEGYDKVIEEYDALDGYAFSFLDMIGALYGINRSMSVEYYDKTAGKDVEKHLRLTNKELYVFIKSRIIQNNYDGSFIQAKQYYDSIGLPLKMFTSDNAGEHAKCYLYLDKNANVTDNIHSLFLGGLLTLKSLGIEYDVADIDSERFGIWAGNASNADSHNSWDIALWL